MHFLYIKKGKEERRYASIKHLNLYEWQVYSDAKKEYFCKYCPFFVNTGVGGYQKNILLNRLVTKPLTQFAKLLGKDGALENQDKHEYHKNGITSSKDFLYIQNNTQLSIVNRVNSYRLKLVAKNYSRLIPILETIIFLGRQNIPFRGHRDDGSLDIDSQINDGNFRTLLRYRINSGDLELKKQLEKSSSRATYISKTTQNILIECCSEAILSIIIANVQAAKIYSIMFDETTDVSNTSQLSLNIRYTDEVNIFESFVGFIDLRKENLHTNEENAEPKMTGIKVGETIIKALKNLNLNLKTVSL